ncbi:MAG: biopolymer transporter ExbD [Oligoflexales bacterium]
MSRSRKHRKHKKKKTSGAKTAELNIMPFIDIFSMLNTFLLVSAVFVNIGIHEVQVPFLSNAPVDEKPKRSLDIKVNIDEREVQLMTEWSAAPVNADKKNYPLDKTGLASLHQELISLRTQYPEADKVTVFSEDTVKYSQLVDVVDAIKVLTESDPRIPTKDDSGQQLLSEYLYEKVVIGSVIL